MVIVARMGKYLMSLCACVYIVFVYLCVENLKNLYLQAIFHGVQGIMWCQGSLACKAYNLVC